MKITLQLKLMPDKEQATALLNTIKQCNDACNSISATAWDTKVFNQFKLHRLVYHDTKNSFNLSAQVVVRCIAKVAQSYKKDKKCQRFFKQLGAVSYDNRILSYNLKNNTASVWSTSGRLKIPFKCHKPEYLPLINGEADIVYRKGKFYLYQTIEVTEATLKNADKFIGVDMGINNIATLNDGTNYGSEQLNAVRDKYFKTRRSLQSKGTKGSKKCLKRLKGREQRHASLINHTISKQIVSKAIATNSGIAIEDLTDIQNRTKCRRKDRRKKYNWSFYQLRSFLEYKAQLAGIPLVVVDPHYTSKTCNNCGTLGVRRQSSFSCPSCGNTADADINAAKNIAQLGAICKQPRKDIQLCCNYITHNLIS